MVPWLWASAEAMLLLQALLFTEVVLAVEHVSRLDSHAIPRKTYCSCQSYNHSFEAGKMQEHEDMQQWRCQSDSYGPQQDH